MFDIECAIADWRRKLRAADVKNATVLDELENHLREDVARQMQSGLGAEKSFEAAARRIGEAHSLKTEFGKAGSTLAAGRTRKENTWVVLLLGFILLLSGGTILHTQMSLVGQITVYTAEVFALVVVCGWRYAAPFLPVASVKQKRLAVGPACGFYMKAGAFLMPAAFAWLFCVVFLMPKLREICLAAGRAVFNFGEAPALLRAWAAIGRGMVFLTAHDRLISGAVVLALILLEWRSHGWRRYRRATVGAGIFLFNFAVLLSITLMVFSALLATTMLIHQVK